MEGRSRVVPYDAERFELRGHGIDVTYEQVPGNVALRHMTVTEDSSEPRRYLGGEIRLEDTNIGTMVTVVTGFAHDGDTRKLSVLLPGVNLTRSPTAEVATVAIRTVDKGSLGGPTLIDGALAKYQSIPLTGTASGGRMSDSPQIDCEWSAWYNDEPPRDDQDLHVAGRCQLPSGSIQIRLEPGNEGIVDDSKLFVLQCTVDVPEVGTDDWVEREVSWRGDVGPDIELVRIQGHLSAQIKVETIV